MNKENIKFIFKKYIDNFEFLNNEKNDESYKWEIAEEFQKFDIDTEDFGGMLNRLWKASDNLIDSSHQLPFYALVDYAQREPETVREMFRKLYSEEKMDDVSKQQVIDEFITSSEKLRKKYYPNSHLYINNQRSVMMLLFLRYPNSNYGYKASQAKSFADCVGFYDDWGPMTNFNLSVFGRMCEQLIEEIRSDKALMDTHMSRYDNTKRKFHKDENLHILALDIIYTSQAYNFYEGITFEPINTVARKLYFERVAKARELAKKLEQLKADMKLLTEAKRYKEEMIVKGTFVKHKKYGEGVIEECVGTGILVSFPMMSATKELNVAVSFGNGLLSLSSEEATQMLREYAPVLEKESQTVRRLAMIEKEIEPYMEFLD